MEADQFGRNWPGNAAHPCPEIASHEISATEHVWLSGHLVAAAAHLPNGMAAKIEILRSQLEVRHQLTRAGRPHRAMMIADAVDEGVRPPSLHARCRHRNPIDATAFNRYVPTDFFETFPAKELAGSGHVLGTGEAEIVRSPVFHKRSAGHAKFRVRQQFG